MKLKARTKASLKPIAVTTTCLSDDEIIQKIADKYGIGQREMRDGIDRVLFVSALHSESIIPTTIGSFVLKMDRRGITQPKINDIRKENKRHLLNKK